MRDYYYLQHLKRELVWKQVNGLCKGVLGILLGIQKWHSNPGVVAELWPSFEAIVISELTKDAELMIDLEPRVGLLGLPVVR
ncbi:uncharacterized protein [Henckelia pumila]